MGSIVRLFPVVTSPLTMISSLVLCSSIVLLASGAPQGQLPPGINPAICPNYPFCGPSPAPGTNAQDAALLAHRAAEEAVRAQQNFVGVVGPSGNIGPSGQVGASGNIGPSGLCGPSGCISFG